MAEEEENVDQQTRDEQESEGGGPEEPKTVAKPSGLVYTLTLRRRDLYLLVFAAALIVFASFILGAIVGRYLGPYPEEKVAAELEEKELFGSPEPTGRQAAALAGTPASRSVSGRKVKPSPRPSPAPSPSPTAPSASPRQAAISLGSPSPTATIRRRASRPSPKPRVRPSPKPVRAKRSKVTFFAVQVGAYAVRANAEAEVSKLNKLGFAARIRRQRHKKKTLYLVLVGRYKSAVACKEVSRRLRQKGYRDQLLRSFTEIR